MFFYRNTVNNLAWEVTCKYLSKNSSSRTNRFPVEFLGQNLGKQNRVNNSFPCYPVSSSKEQEQQNNKCSAAALSTFPFYYSFPCSRKEDSLIREKYCVKKCLFVKLLSSRQVIVKTAYSIQPSLRSPRQVAAQLASHFRKARVQPISGSKNLGNNTVWRDLFLSC